MKPAKCHEYASIGSAAIYHHHLITDARSRYLFQEDAYILQAYLLISYTGAVVLLMLLIGFHVRIRPC